MQGSEFEGQKAAFGKAGAEKINSGGASFKKAGSVRTSSGQMDSVQADSRKVVRVIHTADLHLGFNTFKGEQFDPFKSLEFLSEYAIKNEADIVLIAGDVFDRRDPSSYIQRGFARFVNTLSEAGIFVFILTGNHEGAPNPERSIHLDVYSALSVKNVFVARKIEHLTVRNVNIIAVPYPYKKNLLAREKYKDKSEDEINRIVNAVILKRIEKILSEIDNNYPTILAMHIPLLEGKVGSEQYMIFTRELPMGKNDFDNEKISYVALGHLHKSQVLFTDRAHTPVVYPGSLERIDFSEENDEKGFYSVEFAENGAVSFNFVANPYARRFYTLRIASDGDMKNADWDRIKSSIVRVVLEKDVEDEQAFKAFLEEVKKKSYVFARFEDKRDFSGESNFYSSHLAITPQDAINKYLDEQKEHDPFVQRNKDKILKTALDILRELSEESEGTDE